VRIDVRRTEGLKDTGGGIIGNRTRAKVVKNKVAPPFKEANFDIMFGEGISHEGELLDLAVELGLVQKSGGWFNAGEVRLGQGRDNAKVYFMEHPEFADEIEQKVRENAAQLFAAAKKRKPLAVAKGNLDDLPAAGTAQAPAPSERGLDISAD
jgi:recombination protein RecA